MYLVSTVVKIYHVVYFTNLVLISIKKASVYTFLTLLQ